MLLGGSGAQFRTGQRLALRYFGLSALGLALSCFDSWNSSVVIKELHPLLACAMVGLIACSVGDAKWSYFSPAFWLRHKFYSPEATGILVAYLTRSSPFLSPPFGLGG